MLVSIFDDFYSYYYNYLYFDNKIPVIYLQYLDNILNN